MANTQIDLSRQAKDASMTNVKQAFGTPSASTDVAIKSYVDSEITFLKGITNLKAAARAATTVAGTLTTSFANASVVDGVTLATNDRILIKNQAAGAENGLYFVNATGAPTRVTDADTATEIKEMVVFIGEGTANADSGWKLTNDGAIVLGTTALVYTIFTGATGLTTGNFITNETPTGAVNGTNTAFTLAFTPTAGTVSVYLNGIYQEPGAGNDYTISTNTITYLTAPVTGDKIRANYMK